MTKSELIARLSEDTGVSQADAERVLNSIVETVSGVVASGDSVTVPSLGTFSSKDRAARTGRNPRTGEEIQIAATTVPHFSAATALKKRVAG